MADEGAGRARDAVDAYEAATRSPEQRGRAALRLAEWKARRGKFEEAMDFLAESLKSSPDDLRAWEAQVAIIGAMGDPRSYKTGERAA